MPLAHEGHQLVLDGHVADRRRVVDPSQHFPEQVSEVFFFLLRVLLILETSVGDVETSINEVLVRHVDVQIDCHCLVYSDSSEFLRVVALFYQLQKYLVFELLACGLAQGDHVFNQLKDVVKFGLLTNTNNHLKYLQSPLLVLVLHQS